MLFDIIFLNDIWLNFERIQYFLSTSKIERCLQKVKKI